MTTDTLYYHTTLEIEEYDNYSKIQLYFLNSKPIPSDISTIDHIELAKFIDQIKKDMANFSKAADKSMNQLCITAEFDLMYILDINDKRTDISYTVKRTKEKISRSLSIGKRRKQWDELLPPRYSN
jgi:hypothetical protein